MKGRTTAILFVIVFLLVAAVVATFVAGLVGKQEAEQPQEDPVIVIDPGQLVSAEPAVVVEAPPVSTEPFAAPTQEPGAEIVAEPPVIIDTPTPVIETTPFPAATPAPADPVYAGQDLGSGSFRSETGTLLNIKADWSARSVSATQVEVTVVVSAESSSLYNSGSAVNINLDGQYASLTSKTIDYTDTAMTSHELASKTFTLDLADGASREVDLAVEWHWGGRYGGVALDVLECGGRIPLSR